MVLKTQRFIRWMLQGCKAEVSKLGKKKGNLTERIDELLSLIDEKDTLKALKLLWLVFGTIYYKHDGYIETYPILKFVEERIKEMEK